MKHLPGLLLLIFLVLPGAVVPAAGQPRNLMLTVLQTADMNEVRALLEPAGDTADTGAKRSPATVYGSLPHSGNSSLRQIRVIEGHTAFIRVGHTEPEVRLLWIEADSDNPLPNIDFTRRERQGGFTVSAELTGEHVTLQVQHYNETARAGHQLATVVSGRTGRWLDLGGSLVPEDTPPGVQTYAVRHARHDRMRILVKVEPVE